MYIYTHVYVCMCIYIFCASGPESFNLCVMPRLVSESPSSRAGSGEGDEETDEQGIIRHTYISLYIYIYRCIYIYI